MTEDKSWIHDQLQEAAAKVEEFVLAIPVERFFIQPSGKWSVAQHLEHLTIVSCSLFPALTVGKPRLVKFGQVDRPLMTQVELVALYRKRIAEGLVASGAFVPTTSSAGTREPMIAKFVMEHRRLVESLNEWSEHDLDVLCLPHPALGKLTVREMMFFTAYHLSHHLEDLRTHNG